MRTTTRTCTPDKSVPLPNLLISIRNEQESEVAFEVLNANLQVAQRLAPWIDLKEPSRGSIGRPDLATAHQTYDRCLEFERNSLPQQSLNFSIALGELSESTDEEIADYCSGFGADVFFKIALAGLENDPQWQDRAIRIIQTVGSPSQWILVHYADAEKAQAPTWDEILAVSKQAGCRYILVDTWSKDGRSLLEIMSPETLKHMAAHANAMGLQVAMAGALRAAHMDRLIEIAPSWVGFRSDLCEARERNSSLNPDRLNAVLEMFRSIHSETKALEQNVIR